MAATPAEKVCSLSIGVDPLEFRRASAWLEAIGHEHAVPAEKIAQLDLCLNEALANVLEHGGPSAQKSDIRLELKLVASGGFCTARLTVTDAGNPFNPLDHATRPQPASIAEAEPGGLGIAMMRIHSDKLDYALTEGRNRLGFSVRWQCFNTPAHLPNA